MHVSTSEVDGDNDKIVDVFEVVSNLLLCRRTSTATYNEVPRRSSSNLV